LRAALLHGAPAREAVPSKGRAALGPGQFRVCPVQARRHGGEGALYIVLRRER